MTPPAIEAVGVLGGTFDPVHVGHVRLAVETRRLLGLSRALLVPAANPPHKSGHELSPARHRVAMLRLAILGREGLAISSVELERRGVSYTIDTLRLLRDGDPPCAPVFILGMDSLAQIETWHSWRELLDEFDLAVIDRGADPGTPIEPLPPRIARRVLDLDEAIGEAGSWPGRGGRIMRLPLAAVSVSSSEIRRRARQGGELSGLVPPGVARYIRCTGLYTQEEAL